MSCSPLAVLALAAFLASPAYAQAPALTLDSPVPQASGHFGLATAVVPDANGDGRSDFLVGAPDEAMSGRAHLFSGATGTLLHTLSSPVPGSFGKFGYAVAGVPDVDGDGRGDLVVGAYAEGANAAGRTYLFSGATGTLLYTLRSPAPRPDGIGGFFGIAVAGITDVNGDGRGDVVVSAPRESQTYVFSGASGSVLYTCSPSSHVEAGRSVAAVPDADGDGRSDVLVGTYGTSGGPQDAGGVVLYSGATGALLYALASPAPKRQGNFGRSVAGVPDVDGDGRGDLVVGAYAEGDGASGPGRAYVFSGATGSLLRTLANATADTSSVFGYSVAGVPDVDGDGRGDLAVGAYGEDRGALNAGQAYLFSGATGAVIRTVASPATAANGYFGVSVTGVADTDGDGRGDVLVAEYAGAGGPSEAGRVYLFSSAGLTASESAPAEASALLAAPNPARGHALLSFSLAEPRSVRLSVVDALGREVAVPLDGARPAGVYDVPLDTSGLPAGVYIVRLMAGGSVVSMRLVVAR